MLMSGFLVSMQDHHGVEHDDMGFPGGDENEGDVEDAFAPELEEEEAAAEVVDDDDAPLREFQQKWHAELEEKDAYNETKRTEMRSKAKAELVNFIEQRKLRVQAKIASNREEEEAYMNEQREGLASGNPWERIVSLVDLNSTESDGQSKTDLSRLQHILIQLKNAPLPSHEDGS